jgi:uncharacterized OB-fold protein
VSDVPPRPAPDVSTYGAPFWAAARDHRLVLQHCPRCDRLQHYPRPWCTRCLGDRLDHVDAAGTGVVYSCTVVRRNPAPAFASRVPYVLAIVELDEGVRLFANVVDCDPESVTIGTRVRVTFEDADGGQPVPQFTPIRDGG